MSDDNLLLVNIAGIKVGDLLITDKVLQMDTQRWEGSYVVPIATDGEQVQMSEEEMFRRLCYSLLPLEIIGERGTVLQAKVTPHLYSLDDQPGYLEYSCMISAFMGRIRRVSFRSMSYVKSLSVEENQMVMNLGKLSLTIYYDVVELPESDLPLPDGFQVSRFTSLYR